jgi:tubulin-specific chaperone A
MSTLRKAAPKAGDTLRQLKIKTGVVKRMNKDCQFYAKELAEQQAKVQQMTDDGKCEFDIKQAKHGVDETLMVIPDTQKRFEAGYEELEQFLVKNGEHDEVAGTEELTTAQEIMAAAKLAIYGEEEEKAPEEEEEEY